VSESPKTRPDCLLLRDLLRPLTQAETVRVRPRHTAALLSTQLGISCFTWHRTTARHSCSTKSERRRAEKKERECTDDVVCVVLVRKCLHYPACTDVSHETQVRCDPPQREATPRRRRWPQQKVPQRSAPTALLSPV